MRIDMWQTEREKAETIECGFRVLRGEEQGPKGPRYTLMMWRPKGTRPSANYIFNKLESRENYIAEQVRFQKERQERIENRKREERGTEEQVAAVKVGDIFVNSWGYDQTNLDFYQVVEKNGRMLTLREVAQESVPGTGGFMSEQRVAVRGRFLENSKPIRKVVKFSNGAPYLPMPFGSCSKWGGESQYRSWYA